LPREAYGQRQPDNKNTAVVPVPRDGNWKKRHESFNERAKQGDVDLVFIGDSITQGWEGNGKDVWKKHYGPRKAMNLGIGGDRTQHVLWRLENGNIEGIKPKLAVIMIGTNNSNNKDNTSAEIAEGIKAIVAKLRDKLPETKILLLAVFPRGAMSDAQIEKIVERDEKKKPDAAELPAKIAAKRDYVKSQRKKIADVNETVSKLADNKSIFYLDIGPKFLDADGTIPDDIMPDHLHLSPKGYQIWADAIEAKVADLLGEKK
jgi:beta-glucosidase